MLLEATVPPTLAVPPVLRQQEMTQPVISRRAGRLPLRKIEDSIFETDDRHQFEGSLVKLTGKPGAFGAVNLATRRDITSTEDIDQVH